MTSSSTWAEFHTQDTGMDEEEIFKTIMPRFIRVRQIQQEFSLFTEEEAHAWLREKIHLTIAQSRP